MGAFPSGSGNHISETHLDAGTDKPKDARTDLLDAVRRINQIIDSFNDGDGICGLNSSSKIDSAKLLDVIGTGQLVDDSVTFAKMQNIAAHQVIGNVSGSTGNPQQVSIDHNLDAVAAGHTTLATARAVKDYIDSQVSSLSMNVQQSVKSDFQAIRVTSYTDVSGLSVNITPTASNSKVLVTVHVNAKSHQGYYSSNGIGYFRLYRDSTAIALGDSTAQTGERASFIVPYGAVYNGMESYSISFLDSPSTTNQITYKLMARVRDTDDDLYINRPSETTSTDNRPKVAQTISSITAQEVTQ